MTFERQFVTGIHALAFVGVAALAATNEVNAIYLAAATVGLGWSAWREWRGAGPQLSPQAANVAILAAMTIILAPVFLRGASPVRAIAEFLLVLVGLKGAVRKESRDWLQICVLSFFHLLAASAMTVEPVFALVFFAYLVIAPCVLVLLFLRREVDAAGGGRRLVEESFVEPSLFRSLATTTAVLFVSTLVVFIVFPRMGAGYFGSPFSSGATHVGFSEQVGPGDIAALKEDDAVAMRVVVDRPDLLPEPLYWRGIALDQYDGRSWRRRPQELRPLARPEPGVFTLIERPSASALVREEIVLEPQDSAALFVAGRPIEIHGGFAEASIDAIGNLRVLRPTGLRTRYEVLATTSLRKKRPGPATLDLPPIDHRIVTLVRSLVSDLHDDGARAQALFAYLHRGFRYTQTPGDPGTEDPLVRFLFETKSGHCEYFASALAVMLRLAGVPSLVVSGYAGGDWNPYGGYYLVRQRQAHSWVEAYVGGAWHTFDPTPASLEAGGGSYRRISDLIDAFQMRWYRYVVNYTLEDQAAGALSLRDSLRGLWESVRGDWWQRRGDEAPRPFAEETASIPWTQLWGLVLAALAAWGWRSFRHRQQAGESAPSEASKRYLRLLGALARFGLVKGAGETPGEFARRAGALLGAEAERVERITALYEEARFSGHDPSPERLDTEIASLLVALSDRTARADRRAAPP